tara:strand:- start:101 stop:565 length:465 start_codon:yes stop_codon:yes gene_type:complete
MVYISSDVKHQSVKEHLTHDLVKYYKIQGFSIKKIGELMKLVMENIDLSINKNDKVNKKELSIEILDLILINLELSDIDKSFLNSIANELIDKMCDISNGNTNLNLKRRGLPRDIFQFFFGFCINHRKRNDNINNGENSTSNNDDIIKLAEITV